MRGANSLVKTLMLGKTDGKRRRGRQQMRWLDGIITGSMDMSLSKLREAVKSRETCCAAVHWVAKCWTQLSDWTATTFNIIIRLLQLAINCMGEKKSTLKPFVGMLYIFHRTKTENPVVQLVRNAVLKGFFCLYTWVLSKTCLLCSSWALPPLFLAESQICCNLELLCHFTGSPLLLSFVFWQLLKFSATAIAIATVETATATLVSWFGKVLASTTIGARASASKFPPFVCPKFEDWLL